MVSLLVSNIPPSLFFRPATPRTPYHVSSSLVILFISYKLMPNTSTTTLLGYPFFRSPLLLFTARFGALLDLPFPFSPILGGFWAASPTCAFFSQLSLCQRGNRPCSGTPPHFDSQDSQATPHITPSSCVPPTPEDLLALFL